MSEEQEIQIIDFSADATKKKSKKKKEGTKKVSKVGKDKIC